MCSIRHVHTHRSLGMYFYAVTYLLLDTYYDDQVPKALDSRFHPSRTESAKKIAGHSTVNFSASNELDTIFASPLESDYSFQRHTHKGGFKRNNLVFFGT